VMLAQRVMEPRVVGQASQRIDVGPSVVCFGPVNPALRNADVTLGASTGARRPAGHFLTLGRLELEHASCHRDS
jgi:hypothetical protein